MKDVDEREKLFYEDQLHKDECWSSEGIDTDAVINSTQNADIYRSSQSK